MTALNDRPDQTCCKKLILLTEFANTVKKIKPITLILTKLEQLLRGSVTYIFGDTENSILKGLMKCLI